MSTHSNAFTYTGSGVFGNETIQARGTVLGIPFSCTATQSWIEAGCSLSPGSETVVVNTPHTVTATVLKNGAPVIGLTVHFDVTSGPNSGKSGTALTGAGGLAVF